MAADFTIVNLQKNMLFFKKESKIEKLKIFDVFRR
jgi:hypothetical protein